MYSDLFKPYLKSIKTKYLSLDIKYLLKISTVLYLLTLPMPFIWLEIGPLGKEYYGDDVPDIYILGGYILGKDTNWWAINLAYKLQLFFIAIATINSLLIYKFLNNKKISISLTITNLVLLVLFPFWLKFYTQGVINNSDGAANDLKQHYCFGILLWLLLTVIKIIVLKKLLKKVNTEIKTQKYNHNKIVL